MSKYVSFLYSIRSLTAWFRSLSLLFIFSRSRAKDQVLYPQLK